MRFEISLSALQQRILALTLAAVPLMVLGMMLATFCSEQLTHHARVSLLMHELTKERSLIAKAPSWALRLTTIKASGLWQNIFLPSANRGGEQNQLLQIVKKAGGTVLQSSITFPKPLQGVASEVDENVSFSADITMLTHILYELRTPTPVFVIRRLVIHNEERPRTTPRLIPNQLRIDLTVTGFARPS